MRIEELLRRSAKLYPRVTAVEDAEGALDYAGFAALVARLARVLCALGVGPEDRVAVLARNRADYVALYFAAAALDAALVPLNWRLAPAELRYILEHAEPRALLADPELCALADEALQEAPLARVVLGAARAGWTALSACEEREPPPARGDESTVAVQIYTSGTTGAPKGAMLTHRNVVSMTQAWLLDMHIRPRSDRFLQVTPLFHVGGMMMLMSTLATGATLVLLPEFDPVATIEALSERGITHTLLVPAMIQWVLLEPALRGRSFERLELVVYGAAPIPPSVLQRAFETFGCDFLQGYGLSETAGILLTLRPEDHRFAPGEEPPRRLAAAGRDLFCSTVRVVDAEGRDVAPGEVGEIVARGDNVTPGYWKDPEATRRAFEGGWFHTGDLATVDEEGYVYVVDRLKDMLLVGGENVYPREVEDALMAHPAVADAAVIGVPHEVWGEEALAFVVLDPAAAPVDGRALIRHCRERLARFKCPTRVELRASLPRNAAGKLQKRALREPYWEGRERRV